MLKGANRLKVNIDDLLFYDKEKIKQDVYEVGVKRRNSIEIAINFFNNTNFTFAHHYFPYIYIYLHTNFHFS